MYPYQYSPPVGHPVYHGFDEWQQIRYPPAMPGEHAPGQNFHHFPPVSVSSCWHERERRLPCELVWGSLLSEWLLHGHQATQQGAEDTCPVGA